MNPLEVHPKKEPVLIILFLDQTGSTNRKSKYGIKSIAEKIADEANHFIYNLVLSNCGRFELRDNFYIKIIAASNGEINVIIEGWLLEVADNPIGTIRKNKMVRDRHGRNLKVEEYIPFWIDARSYGHAPSDFTIINKTLKNWHTNKPKDYPKSIIVTFWEDEDQSIKLLDQDYSDLNCEKPIFYEKLFQ